MHSLSKLSVLIGSAVFLIIMFCIVTFAINPLIDGGDGSGLLKLQLAFDKAIGLEIINSWGASGRENFRRFIFTDYIYAVSYAVFLASLLAFLMHKNADKNSFLIYLSLSAGALDWIENSMEVFFVNNPATFSSSLFYMHSLAASLKWVAIIVTIVAIGVLLIKKLSYNQKEG